MNLSIFNPRKRFRDLQFLSGWHRQKWPDSLYIIRHGESNANAERERAQNAGESQLQLKGRDVDVPLSNLGTRQTALVGKWFATLPRKKRPTVFISSPFRRADSTRYGIIDSALGTLDDAELVTDERLGERECGILEGLTKAGVRERLPSEAHRRDELGKMYYRPPGGESWADVILRLRSFLDMVIREYPGERVAITCHSVVVCCFRYLLERQTESTMLELDRSSDVANCSVTAYHFDRYAGRRGKLLLDTPYYLCPGLKELTDKG